MLLPDFRIVLGHSRSGDRLPDVGQGVAGVAGERGAENITRVSSSSFADHQLPPVQGGEPCQLAGRYLAPEFIPRHRESSSSLLHLRGRHFTYNPEWMQAKREEMDLEANVCAKSSTSLQILPHLTKVIVMHVSLAL